MAIAMALALMAHAATKPPAKGTQVTPLGNVQTWFSAKDYPQEATVKRQEGTVGFQLDIDPNGLPSDCKIIQSSGTKLLDDRTCTIMMARARFRPLNGSLAAITKKKKGRKGVAPAPLANDASSPALATGPTRYFRHTMVWKLPKKGNEQLVDRSFDAKSLIAPTGEVLSCTLSGAGASKIAASGGSCGPFGDRNFIAFFLGDDYKKVRATNIRMSILANGAPVPPTDRPPNFQKVLARSDLDIAPTGEMTKCTAAIVAQAVGHPLDLCDFIRADPPRFPAGAPDRKASIVLDLNAFF